MTGTEIYITILTAAVIVMGFLMKKAFAEIDKLKSNISDVKDNYLTRDEFLREQTKTDRKLDKIVNILLEMKEVNR